MKPGAFIISLDLELYWGMRDKRRIEDYGANLLGARNALPQMLHTFDEHDVKSTIAAVGLLFFDRKDTMVAALPVAKPSYTNKHLSPYTDHFERVGENEHTDPYHFGASLIRAIQEHPAHEVGCHTFSHYYCLEKGQTEAQFEADLQAAREAAATFGIDLRSFVFPRNQYNANYLSICRTHGITAYRGNEEGWLYAARNGEDEGLLRRAFRLLDTWVDLSGPNCHPFPDAMDGLPFNIPSSRFLRPWNSRWRALEGLRLRRITRAMDHAARSGKIFHLWWHPHNFGMNLDRNLDFLNQVLAHFSSLREMHGFRSMTMGEVAREALTEHGT